ncbi:MAG TPA: acyl-CoA dehydrogenase family protein [Rhizomicrobium sp.]|nr:acyl-CoA dehydrogenase family protein [Rhizomicrobium sp.]
MANQAEVFPVTENFVEEVRDFLGGALTPDLRQAGRETIGVHSEIGTCRIWHQRLYAKGWIAPAWPVGHGGTGWSLAQRFFFEQECARNDAPILFAIGLRSIGPLIIALGTPEQKRRYLHPILSGEDLWCQGFSEANAGSDLAAITTHAVALGDNYIVTGCKLWTTGAHLANRMFALVRTRSSGKPQDGITFLLIDMAAPGISVRPIVTLDGQHEFNEVTFDDVSVPIANRLGAENEGWGVAKHLMRFARSNNTNSSLLRRAWRGVERLQTASLEPALKMRMTEIEIELAAFESLEMRLLASGRLSGNDEAGSSLMKIAATELHQRIAELLLDAADPYGGTTYPLLKYFGTRAASIYSGTNEIHRNVIAKHL